MTFPAFTNFPAGINEPVTENVYNVQASTVGLTLGTADVQNTTTPNVAPADFVCLAMTGTLAAGANAQLPLAASMLSAFGGVAYSYVFQVNNLSSANFAWTLTTNTGWTLSGTMSVAQNTVRDFIVTVRADGTATIQSIGTGTIS